MHSRSGAARQIVKEGWARAAERDDAKETTWKRLRKRFRTDNDDRKRNENLRSGRWLCAAHQCHGDHRLDRGQARRPLVDVCGRRGRADIRASSSSARHCLRARRSPLEGGRLTPEPGDPTRIALLAGHEAQPGMGSEGWPSLSSVRARDGIRSGKSGLSESTMRAAQRISGVRTRSAISSGTAAVGGPTRAGIRRQRKVGARQRIRAQSDLRRRQMEDVVCCRIELGRLSRPRDSRKAWTGAAIGRSTRYSSRPRKRYLIFA